MTARLRSLADDLRESLFWLPLAMVAAGVALAVVVGRLEEHYGHLVDDFPLLVVTTPEARRTLLEVLALADVTVVGLVSSVLVIAVQLASSQFSPRVLRSFLRDRVSQTAIGTIIGTFAYCTYVLVANHPEAAATGEPAPDLPATVALVLAALSVVMIMAFIDNTARSMQVTRIIRRITEETRGMIELRHDRTVAEALEEEVGELPPPAHVVRSPRDGWVQRLDGAGLVGALPAGATARIDLPVGKFAIEGTPLVSLWDLRDGAREDGPGSRGEDGPGTPEDTEKLDRAVLGAYQIGPERELRHDIAFGLRQLVDIALRALSPAINDPGTAYEVISNLGAVLGDLLRRDLTARVSRDPEGRTLIQPYAPDHAEFVHLAFEQLRVAAAPHPAVTVAILTVLERLDELLAAAELEGRRGALREQARLAVQDSHRHEHADADLQRIREAARRLGVAGEDLQPA